MNTFDGINTFVWKSIERILIIHFGEKSLADFKVHAGVPCNAFWHRLLLPCAFLRAAVLAALCFCRLRKNVSGILFKMTHGFYRWSVSAHTSPLVYWFKTSIYMVKVKVSLLWWVPFLTEIVTGLQWEQKGCNEELPSVSHSEMRHDPYLMQLLILQPFMPAAES